MKKLSLFLFCCAMFTTFCSTAQVKQKTVTKATATKTKTVTKTTTTGKPVTRNPKLVTIAPDHSIKVKISTDSGVIIVKLYDSTPLHRDNFVKLVNGGFYDSLMFHRVIAGFMIQGGDPLSKNAQPDVMLGNGGSDMTRIPAEFRSSLIHKKGALAAARDNNPEKASSACQFYIVQGKTATDAELDMLEQRNGIKYTAAQRLIYKTIGGTPFLDQNYTVFGEVISGLDVIDKIASVPTNGANRPTGDVRMKMEVIK